MKWSIICVTLPGIAHVLKKNIIIFHVGNDLKDPISIVRPDLITGGEADNEVPLLAVYDGVHYESVYPASKTDQYLTKVLIVNYPEFKGDNFKTFFKEIVFVGQNFGVDDYEKKSKDSGAKSKQEMNAEKMSDPVECASNTKDVSRFLSKKDSTAKEPSGKVNISGVNSVDNINTVDTGKTKFVTKCKKSCKCCIENNIDLFPKDKEEDLEKKNIAEEKELQFTKVN